jgi:HTH-type transcriptional regulator/antitoxin HigA
MKPRELIPYLGTKPRVSEILNSQRQPTVDQTRVLHQHRGIPADSLIRPIEHESVARPSTASLPAVDKLKTRGVMKPKEDLGAFLARATRIAPAVAMLRKTRTERTNAKTDFGALEAWCAAVLVNADAVRLPKRAKHALGFDEARRLAKLSLLPDWSARQRYACETRRDPYHARASAGHLRGWGGNLPRRRCADDRTDAAPRPRR